ncbi:prolactin-like, partial [Arapaima gigas]
MPWPPPVSAEGKTIGNKMTWPSWGGTFRLTVAALLCVSLRSHTIGINDLLDRASQLSDRLHSLSASLTNDLDSHLPPMGRMMMPRPSMCHTSSLQTPSDKDQALRVPEPELLSLIRSLLLSWNEPLVLLSLEAPTLPHPSNSAIYSKTKELQDNTQNLNVGLDRLVHKVSDHSVQAVQQCYGTCCCLCMSPLICPTDWIQVAHLSPLQRTKPRQRQDLTPHLLLLPAVLLPKRLAQNRQLPQGASLQGGQDVARDVL